jgi:hypothetical protein
MKLFSGTIKRKMMLVTTIIHTKEGDSLYSKLPCISSILDTFSNFILFALQNT